MISKTIILSSKEKFISNSPRAILTLITGSDHVDGKLRLYNMDKLTDGTKLGVYSHGNVWTANLNYSSNSFDFKLDDDFVLNDEIYCALVDTKNNNNVVLSGGSMPSFDFEYFNEDDEDEDEISDSTLEEKYSCEQKDCANCEYKKSFYEHFQKNNENLENNYEKNSENNITKNKENNYEKLNENCAENYIKNNKKLSENYEENKNNSKINNENNSNKILENSAKDKNITKNTQNLDNNLNNLNNNNLNKNNSEINNNFYKLNNDDDNFNKINVNFDENLSENLNENINNQNGNLDNNSNNENESLNENLNIGKSNSEPCYKDSINQNLNSEMEVQTQIKNEDETQLNDEDNSTEIETQSTDEESTEQTEKFLQAISDQLDEMFRVYPLDETIMKIIPNSKIVKVTDNVDNNDYIVGLIYEDEEIKYLLYGVPAKYNEEAPKELGEHYQFLPLSPDDPMSDGYYLVYQDATSGKLVTINVE